MSKDPARRRATPNHLKWAIDYASALEAELFAVEPLNRFEFYFMNTIADGVDHVAPVARRNFVLLI